jgi:hypothetical protein
MKKYHSFGKSALTALLVTMLVGATLGCSDNPLEDDLILQSIAVTTLPTKTVYVRGEALDISGLVVTGTYADGTTKTEPVSLANISGYNPDSVSQQTLTVTVNGKTATFIVAVNEPVLQSIAVTSTPTTTVYVLGDPLDITGLVVTGTYSGGTTKTEPVSLSDISGYDADTVGIKTLTVTVDGKQTTFTVTVNNTALQSITITSPPIKTLYTQGDPLDITGLVVTGTYADGTTKAETVSLSSVRGYNAEVMGTQTLTVAVNDKTATFIVTVNELILQSIAVTSLPVKTVYIKGETLDITGLVVTGTYSNGMTSVAIVNLSDISGYDANTEGQQTLIVTITGKTATFTVTVNPPVGLDELADLQGGDTEANPVHLALSLDLANGGWESILSTIANADKYVSLDLSACTMAGTEFDPGSGEGADRVTALVLPEAAKSIKSGTWEGDTSNATFKAFTALASLSGVGIETVGDFAFHHCTSLMTVSLPVATTIGDSAFVATSLASVSLPAVQTIDIYAFGWCESLTTVSLSASLTTVVRNPFAGCPNLTSITVDPSNTVFTFHDGMLLNKAETTLVAYLFASGDITLSSITEIGDGAFSACYSLTSVSLPTATTVGIEAFQDCMSLESVNLPVATTIGDRAFQQCGSLTTVSLPVAQTIGTAAFQICTSLTTVSLPAAQTIGDWVFAWCDSLEAVSLAASLTTVCSNPFAGCSALATITVDPVNTAFTAHDGMLLNKAETNLIAYPSATGAIALPSIIEIGDRAFYWCDSLMSVSLPTATSIGDWAFGGCTSLMEVSLPASPPALGGDIFVYTTGYNSSGTITVSVPVGTVSAYTSKWDVDTNTPANGNNSVYGESHKAIIITDAAQ